MCVASTPQAEFDVRAVRSGSGHRNGRRGCRQITASDVNDRTLLTSTSSCLRPALSERNAHHPEDRTERAYRTTYRRIELPNCSNSDAIEFVSSLPSRNTTPRWGRIRRAMTMSVQPIGRGIRTKPSNRPLAKLVLLALANHSTARAGPVAHPQVDTLATECLRRPGNIKKKLT